MKGFAWVAGIGAVLLATEFTSVIGDTLGMAIAGPGLVLLAAMNLM